MELIFAFIRMFKAKLDHHGKHMPNIFTKISSEVSKCFNVGTSLPGMIKRSMARRSGKSKKVAVKKEVLSEKAYEYIAHQLLTNQLSPGDLINRRQIAAELKMSVAPVLEAIVQLESDGFLQSISRKGTLVRAVKPEDLRGELILREAYECQAARIYCGEPIRRNREALRVLAQAVEDNRKDQEKVWDSEFNFHYALIQLTECPALIRAFEKVMRRKLFMSMHLYLQVHPEPYHDDHLQLLEALSVDDPDQAEKAMHRHFLSRAHLTQVRRA